MSELLTGRKRSSQKDYQYAYEPNDDKHLFKPFRTRDENKKKNISILKEKIKGKIKLVNSNSKSELNGAFTERKAELEIEKNQENNLDKNFSFKIPNNNDMVFQKDLFKALRTIANPQENKKGILDRESSNLASKIRKIRIQQCRKNNSGIIDKLDTLNSKNKKSDDEQIESKMNN